MNSKQLTALSVGSLSYPAGIIALLAGISWGGLIFLLMLPSLGYLIASDLRKVA